MMKCRSDEVGVLRKSFHLTAEQARTIQSSRSLMTLSGDGISYSSGES